MSWSFDHHSLLSGTMIRIKFFWTLVKKGNAETYLQILSTPLDDFKRTFFQKFEWENECLHALHGKDKLKINFGYLFEENLLSVLGEYAKTLKSINKLSLILYQF
jgi:hypothetical protein